MINVLRAHIRARSRNKSFRLSTATRRRSAFVIYYMHLIFEEKGSRLRRIFYYSNVVFESLESKVYYRFPSPDKSGGVRASLIDNQVPPK